MRPLDRQIQSQLNAHLDKIENILNSDVISIKSPIVYTLDFRVREAIESIDDKRPSLVIIHDTPGGIVEVVQRIVDCIRHFYDEVIFIIPDRAMSAGTIFALSGNKILMDYFSCLGPIDPQLEKDGKLVPALSYLNQFNRLNDKAKRGDLTSAEYALLSKLDLGELYQFEQARELSIELLKEWLSKYKFKDWAITEKRRLKVTDKLKKKRAQEIATILSESSRWHSHGRGINMKTLIEEINLKIEDYNSYDGLGVEVRDYFELLIDYMSRENYHSLIHVKKGFF